MCGSKSRACGREPAADGLTELLRSSAPNARIVARKNYLTKANWKLVLENFLNATTAAWRIRIFPGERPCKGHGHARQYKAKVAGRDRRLARHGDRFKGVWEPGDLDTMPSPCIASRSVPAA